MSRRAITWIVVIVLLQFAVVAHGSTRRQSDIPDDVTHLADSMLSAFDSGNYKKFSADFAAALRNDMDKDAFLEWRAPLADSLGDYLSITDATVKKGDDGNPDRYVFTASFSKDDSVGFVIVFKPGTDRIKRVNLKPDK